MPDFHQADPFPLAMGAKHSISPLAQFRTCLWLRAGRWISGQEAGKTPTVLGRPWWRLPPLGLSRTGSRRRKPAALPEAGDAAQSNDGAGFFRRDRSFQRPVELKRLVLLAGRAAGFPLQSKAVLPESNSLREVLPTAHLTASASWHRCRTDRQRVSTMRGGRLWLRLGSLGSSPGPDCLGGK